MLNKLGVRVLLDLQQLLEVPKLNMTSFRLSRQKLADIKIWIRRRFRQLFAKISSNYFKATLFLQDVKCHRASKFNWFWTNTLPGKKVRCQLICSLRPWRCIMRVLVRIRQKFLSRVCTIWLLRPPKNFITTKLWNSNAKIKLALVFSQPTMLTKGVTHRKQMRF